MTADIRLFPCLNDNFCALIHDPVSQATAVIDAPESAPIFAALKDTGWQLTDILVTHHHGDHTAGIPDLKAKTGCRVTAPKAEASKIPLVEHVVGEGDIVKVGNIKAKVLDTPGHTLGHISYWFADDEAAFVGDTLFSVGCGKLLEGDAPMMWHSLLKLRALPAATKIYCGHEYTLSNIRFALSIDPDNKALQARAAEAERQRAEGKPTIPTTIGGEKLTNPFLRADDAALAASLGLKGFPPEVVFADIRKRKDKF